jgi:hypothetical protein
VYRGGSGRSLTDAIRFEGRAYQAAGGDDGTVHYVPRRTVAHHLCGAGVTKDPHINHALAGRFGLKAVKAMAQGCGQHARDALALAVYWDEAGRAQLEQENQDP